MTDKLWTVGRGRRESVGKSDEWLAVLLGSSCRSRAFDMGSD